MKREPPPGHASVRSTRVRLTRTGTVLAAPAASRQDGCV